MVKSLINTLIDYSSNKVQYNENFLTISVETVTDLIEGDGLVFEGDENTKVRVVVPAGHCLLSTITGQPGGKQHFARNFSSKKHGTKGVVFVGTIVYVPQQEAAPATLPPSQDSSASSQKPRTRSIVQRE